jgi:hypothetical protein
MITLALRSCLRPRIGRSRAFNLPWSHSIPLLAYWSVRCHAAGRSSSTTAGVHRRLIGNNLDRREFGRADRPLEEPTGSLRVPACGDEHVDDLAELVDRSVNIAPLASDLHIRLVDLPAVAHSMAARLDGVGQQRRKAEHPPVDRHVVDLDTALSEQLRDSTVGQPEAQVPADRDDDDIGREPESDGKQSVEGSTAESGQRFS